MSNIVDVSRLSQEKQPAARLIVTESILSGLLQTKIERAEVWHNVVWVKPVDSAPKFVSKKAVWDYYRHLRRERATRESFTFHPKHDRIVVQNPAKNTQYEITHHAGMTHCSCPDFQNQYAVIGKYAICKHIYAYTNYHRQP